MEECVNCKVKSVVEEMLQTPFNIETAEGGDYFCNEECRKEHENKKPNTAWEYCVDKATNKKK